MKISSLLIILAIAVSVVAQERIGDNLRKGVVEEESKHDLDAAIQDYQAALGQFDQARQGAASAAFRLAECYRKQGKDNQAIEAYKRVVRDFADQTKLAEDSRSTLTGTYHQAAVESPTSVQERARRVYRDTLERELVLAQQAYSRAEHLLRVGTINAATLDDFERPLLEAQRALAAFDAGIVTTDSRRK
jgi:tetratricopeptide (TPR) repeat protein